MIFCNATVYSESLKSSLNKTLDDLNQARLSPENSLEKFKEDKMRETLILNIKLVNLQRQASKLQAKTSERKTFLGGQNKCWINYSIN